MAFAHPLSFAAGAGQIGLPAANYGALQYAAPAGIQYAAAAGIPAYGAGIPFGAAGIPQYAGIQYAAAAPAAPAGIQYAARLAAPVAPKAYAVPAARLVHEAPVVQTITEPVEQHGYKIRY